MRTLFIVLLICPFHYIYGYDLFGFKFNSKSYNWLSDAQIDKDASLYQYCLNIRDPDNRTATLLASCAIGHLDTFQMRLACGSSKRTREESLLEKQISQLQHHDRVICAKIKEDNLEVFEQTCGTGNNKPSYLQQVNLNMELLKHCPELRNQANDKVGPNIRWTINDVKKLLCKELKAANKKPRMERANEMTYVWGNFLTGMSMIRMSSAGCTDGSFRVQNRVRNLMKLGYSTVFHDTIAMALGYSIKNDLRLDESRVGISQIINVSKERSQYKNDGEVQDSLGSGVTTHKYRDQNQIDSYKNPYYRWVNNGLHPVDEYIFQEYSDNLDKPNCGDSSFN